MNRTRHKNFDKLDIPATKEQPEEEGADSSWEWKPNGRSDSKKETPKVKKETPKSKKEDPKTKKEDPKTKKEDPKSKPDKNGSKDEKKFEIKPTPANGQKSDSKDKSSKKKPVKNGKSGKK